jgi:hypothetical protein
MDIEEVYNLLKGDLAEIKMQQAEAVQCMKEINGRTRIVEQECIRHSSELSSLWTEIAKKADRNMVGVMGGGLLAIAAVLLFHLFGIRL